MADGLQCHPGLRSFLCLLFHLISHISGQTERERVEVLYIGFHPLKIVRRRFWIVVKYVLHRIDFDVSSQWAHGTHRHCNSMTVHLRKTDQTATIDSELSRLKGWEDGR